MALVCTALQTGRIGLGHHSVYKLRWLNAHASVVNAAASGAHSQIVVYVHGLAMC
jgi:hypothetical protein